MSSNPLSDRTKQELASLARRRGIKGWEGMKKDELVRALTRAAAKSSKPAARPAVKAAAKKVATKPAAKVAAKPAKVAAKPAAKVAAQTVKPSANGAAKHGNAPAKATALPARPPAAPPRPAAPAARPVAPPAPRPEPVIPADKDLSSKSSRDGAVKDRIVVTAPDPFWLHAFWELSVQSVQRAEAALGQDWHGARPIIRLFDVTSQDTTSTSEAPLRDMVVHGGCSHWYIDVPQPPRSYRADIGYLSRRGQFYVLARSNVIVPPKVGASELVEEGGGEARADRSAGEAVQQAQQVLDEQLRRPLRETAFGTGAVPPGKLKKFFFDIDAELIVRGQTDPGATVTLQNEPVKLTPDGRFTMRFSLPDSRQIIPAVATSHDGMEEQTIVLAVERNTKRLDPMVHDLYGEN
jgi:hypothetical protein